MRQKLVRKVTESKQEKMKNNQLLIEVCIYWVGHGWGMGETWVGHWRDMGGAWARHGWGMGGAWSRLVFVFGLGLCVFAMCTCEGLASV